MSILCLVAPLHWMKKERYSRLRSSNNSLPKDSKCRFLKLHLCSLMKSLMTSLVSSLKQRLRSRSRLKSRHLKLQPSHLSHSRTTLTISQWMRSVSIRASWQQWLLLNNSYSGNLQHLNPGCQKLHLKLGNHQCRTK